MREDLPLQFFQNNIFASFLNYCYMKAIVFTNYLVYYLKYIILQSLLLRFFQNNKPLEYMKNAREDKAQIKLLSLQSILFDVWDHKRKRKRISSVTALLPPFPSYSFPDPKKKRIIRTSCKRSIVWYEYMHCVLHPAFHKIAIPAVAPESIIFFFHECSFKLFELGVANFIRNR
jgi:hypothetical protein